MAKAEPTVITLTGDWDIYRRDELRRMFAPSYDEPYLVLDLSAVTYADSTILSELVRMRKHRSEKKLPGFALVPSKRFERVLAITRLDQIWPCFETLDDAIASLTDSLPANAPG
jgi:anti-anti-sigma factor